MTESLAEKVKRDSCPLRRSFVQRSADDEELTPLTRLLRTTGEAGGKGAGLRLTLLLSLIWLNAREPYSTTRVAPYWAELLGRDDPQGEGARAIRDCLHQLRDRRLIELHARGSRIEIVLNNELSKRGVEPAPYTPPYGKEQYLSIPRAFWTSGVIGELSGAGVAMYLVALAHTTHDDPEFFLSGEHFESRYGISRSSRKRGLAELVAHGVLAVRVEEMIATTSFRRARRNLYTVDPAFLQPAPRPNPQQATTADTPAAATAGSATAAATPPAASP